ncbi:hypothetical protein M9H77_19244 [Catharanthus roseus]|uniref:Uncharacterized protein n=1 Tax=Catharanthus roseus TaxID=4058 RepID=A0ACC0B9R5_CATRO|nr:hypothetical protein M9H77_19244 [Catharanthus roseus]
MASSSPSPSNAELALPPPDAESQLSSLIYDLSNQVHVAMENMLKMINEIDQNSAEVSEEIEKCKVSTFERKKLLEDEKENCQKAAYAVLELLNSREVS